MPTQEKPEPAPAVDTAKDPPAPRETEGDPEPEPLAQLDLEVPRKYECEVKVEAVLTDESYRGHRNTPAHVAWVESLDSESYEMYIGESHFESYRECSYRVVVAGKTWRFTEDWSTTFDELPSTWCDDARDHVAAAIQRATHGCSDLHGGAYHGADLVPLP